MQVISDATLTRLFQAGETECSNERPFLVERISIQSVINQSDYVMPDQCLSIRRMQWLGWKMDPLPARNWRDVFQGQNYQVGRPFWYIYNNIGLQTVKLFPSPDQVLATVSNPWQPSQCMNAFTVEYFRSSDSITFTLPPWIRQQLLKIYVAKQIYAMEGPDQSLALAKYFSQKWQLKKKEFFTLLDALYGEPRKLVTNQIISNNYFPGSPVLPITKFGISVEPGYD